MNGKLCVHWTLAYANEWIVLYNDTADVILTGTPWCDSLFMTEMMLLKHHKVLWFYICYFRNSIFFTSCLSAYLKVSAFISLHNLSCPSRNLNRLLNKLPNISHCIHFTFPQYLVIIKPFTSKRRLTLKVKLDFLFSCPERRVKAVQTIGVEFPLSVYQLALFVVWKAKHISPSLPQKCWTICRQS